MYGNARADPEVGNKLQRCVVDRHRKFPDNLGTPFFVRRNNARPYKDRSNPGIFRSGPAKTIDIFVFAGEGTLQPNNRIRTMHHVIPRTAAPSEVVREMV